MSALFPSLKLTMRPSGTLNLQQQGIDVGSCNSDIEEGMEYVGNGNDDDDVVNIVVDDDDDCICVYVLV